jgi:hypothetical protein
VSDLNTIFWSWQSDLDHRTNRDVVRLALEQAIGEIAVELEEADRPTLTHDTKDIAGTPDIVATILAKIEAASIFVADLTPIAVSDSSKAVANPNVLIELGFAKHALGLERIILVWNTSYSGTKPEDLPFDLRGRRAPISFCLETGATTEDVRRERDRLKKQLSTAILASLRTVASEPDKAPNWQVPVHGTPSQWQGSDQILKINESSGPVMAKLSDGPCAYARIVPSAWTEPADFGEVHGIPMGQVSGYSWGRTTGGFLTFETDYKEAGITHISNLTMQFHDTGEVWGRDSNIVDATMTEIRSSTLLWDWEDFLRIQLSRLKTDNAKGPFHVILGVDEIGETKLPYGWRGDSNLALEHRIEIKRTLTTGSSSEIEEVLLVAWTALYRAFGMPKPDMANVLEVLRPKNGPTVTRSG